jgi:hypothetical protein
VTCGSSEVEGLERFLELAKIPTSVVVKDSGYNAV